MTKNEDKNIEPKNFEVETVFKDSAHERHAFTVSIKGKEYKGHFHGEKIHWFHPHPQQTIEESNLKKVETSIYKLLNNHGISSGIEELELKKAFEDRIHERYQFTLQVFGEEFKGLLHEGEIQWFHPHPKQKLEDKHVVTIESEVQKMMEQHQRGNAEM